MGSYPVIIFFFFSSRRRHTRFKCDWSSDVCSSDLGQDIARLSIADDNIVVLLHRLKQPTIFTRDGDFFNRRLCHPAYGLVFLDVAPEEAALFARRVLRHPRFSTKASPMGIVLRAHRD